MNDAAMVLRKSQGSEDDISLKVQRSKVTRMLEDNGYLNPDIYDLGVHTGFSIHTKQDADERIDNNPQVQDLLQRLRDGEYDVVAAHDYSRICRDEYMATIREAALRGEAEFAFVEGDDDMGSMTSEINRAVEKHVKRQEIRKSKEALKRKKENGEPLGPAPTGLQYTDDKTGYKTDDDFPLVKRVLRLRDNGASYPEIESKTGVSRSTAYTMCEERRELYERFMG